MDVGAIKLSKFTFVMGINFDPQNPQQNLLLCSFNGSLTISDLVRLHTRFPTGRVSLNRPLSSTPFSCMRLRPIGQINMAVDLAGRAGVKVPALPTIPGFELRKLLIKIAAKDVRLPFFCTQPAARSIRVAFGEQVTIADVTYQEGLEFKCDFTLFPSVIVTAGFKISSGGVEAKFKSTRVKLLGDVFQLCKNEFCNADEGPEFEMKAILFPPVFLLKAEGFASLLGVKMGVRIFISWTGLIDFKAEFNALPIEIKMPGTDWTVFKLSAASGPISGRRLLSAVTSDDAAAQDVEDLDVSGRADAAT
jgi:hypothetical protein